MNELVQNYMAARKRLWKPLNGRASSEIEVVSEPVMRQRRLERAKEIAEIHRARMDAARQAEIENMIREALEERALAKAIATQLLEDEPLPKIPTVSEILRAVCIHYRVKMIDLTSARRNAKICRPRHVAMYLARHLTTNSLPQIGMKIGGRDHTTVLHGVSKIEGLITTDPQLSTDIETIKKALGIT